jgi:hypothetical protein
MGFGGAPMRFGGFVMVRGCFVVIVFRHWLLLLFLKHSTGHHPIVFPVVERLFMPRSEFILFQVVAPGNSRLLLPAIRTTRWWRLRRLSGGQAVVRVDYIVDRREVPRPQGR